MQLLRILIVDDDETTRRLLHKRLKEADYEVETAANGSEAVRMIARQFFDVILTDLIMPGSIDGIAVLSTAKEASWKTEVILMTAHGSVDTAILAMKKGAADYLQKPINLDELFLRLEKIQSLKHLLKNADDLREAMDVSEHASCETIQHLELMVSDLEQRMANIKSILSNNDIVPQERIRTALAV